MNRVEGKVATSTASNAEGRDFTHVHPGTVIAGYLVVSDHLINPPLLSVFGKPVREDSISRPDITDIEAAVWVRDERFGVISSLKDGVSRTTSAKGIQAVWKYQITYASSGLDGLGI